MRPVAPAGPSRTSIHYAPSGQEVRRIRVLAIGSAASMLAKLTTARRTVATLFSALPTRPRFPPTRKQPKEVGIPATLSRDERLARAVHLLLASLRRFSARDWKRSRGGRKRLLLL